MQYSGFFDEIFSSIVVATDSAMEKYLPYLLAHKKGAILDFPAAEKLYLGLFDGMMNMPYDAKCCEDKATGVAVIPLQGLLTKCGSWWDCGTDEIAQTLFSLYADDSIKAIVLDINSPGGTSDSVIPMENAIAKRNKPIISAINASCYSSANYIACLTDNIQAVHRMAGIGSIGVMASWYNQDKYLKDNGIKMIEIYAPESAQKNLPSREADAGKPKLFQEEILSPWAIHFQNIMKANRKNLDLSVDGILNGRTFYAYDAVTNGLIDGIKPMDEILQYAFDYSNRKKFETL